MGARTWVVAGLVAAGVGVAAGMLLVSPARLVAAPPNAELAPDTLVAWIEADGLRPVWDAVAASEAWSDLRESELLARLRDSSTGRAAADLAQRVESDAKYALDAARTMHFVGRQASLGIDRLPADGDPAWLALTKLDVDALVGEMLRGERDWRGLHDELDRRAAAMEFRVTRSAHRGRGVSTATRGDVEFHAALLGDTLAVSSSAELLRRSIDLHEDGGGASLGRTPRFRDEVARLPKGGLAYDWVDLAALRASRAPLLAWADRRDASGALSGAIGRVLEGTSGVPALARSMEMPSGDLYRVRWAHSRTAAEMAGSSGPADLAALVEGHAATAEVRDLGAIAGAWERSPLRRRIAAGPIGEKVREWMDAPSKLRDAMRGSPLASLTGDEDGEEDEGTAPAAAGRADRFSGLDRFTVRMMSHLAAESLTQCFSGSAAIGAGPGDADAPAACTVAAGLGPQGHLLALAAEGAAVARDGPVRRSDRGGSVVFEAPPVRWTHVGDVLVVTTEQAHVDRALAAAGGAAPAAASALPPGWCARMRASGDALSDWMGRSLGEAAGTMRAQLPATVEAAVYLGPDLAWAECRTVARYTRQIVPMEASGRPRTWSWLPEPTVGAVGCSLDFVRLIDEVRRVLGDDASRSIDEGLREASGELGVDIRRELLPALGPEFVVAVVHAAAPKATDAAEEPAPFLPGIVLSVEVRDEAVARRALDGVLAALRRSSEEDGGSAADAPYRVVEETADGARVVRFVLREPDGPPLEPTVALGGGRLLVGLESSVVRACLDAAAGRTTSLAGAPFAARVAERLPDAGGAWGVLDWNRTADQVAEYAPMIAASLPDAGPADGRQPPQLRRPGRAAYEQYERDMRQYRLDCRSARLPEVRRWIDAFRLIDFAAFAGTNRGDTEERRFVVRFAE